MYDPFAGSGTTLVTAGKLGRRFLGTEISEQYVAGIRERLGSAEEENRTTGQTPVRWPPLHREELGSLYLETGLSTDQMYAEPFLFEIFCKQFNSRMAHLGVPDADSPQGILSELEWMRRNGKLGRIKTHAQESFTAPVRPAPRGARGAAAGTLFGPS